MLNLLLVCAENGRDDLAPRVAETWRDFESAVHLHPLAGISVEFGPASPDELSSLAVCQIPDLNVATGRVILSERLLAGTTSKTELVLTLLHEVIHLRVMSAMPSRTRRVDSELRKLSYRLCAMPQVAPAGFREHQGFIASCFLKFPDEVWAEQYLKAEHADWFDKRMDYYVRMREGNAATRNAAAVHSTLQPFAVIHELLRIRLGQLLDSSTDRLIRLEAARAYWAALLNAETMPSGLIPESALRELLPDGFEARALDEAPYDRMFERILAVAGG